MDNARELLAKNMKRARSRLGISQMKLAERIGCSTSLIGDIEICKKFPSAENLDKIAESLALSTYELFYEEKTAAVNLESQERLTTLMLQLKRNLTDEIDKAFANYMRTDSES